MYLIKLAVSGYAGLNGVYEAKLDLPDRPTCGDCVVLSLSDAENIVLTFTCRYFHMGNIYYQLNLLGPDIDLCVSEEEFEKTIATVRSILTNYGFKKI